MIKIAVFDIDGTLFDEVRREYPPSAVDALSRLQQRGIAVAVATGRPPATAAVLRSAGIFPDYLVCSNGHLVLGRNGRILEDRRFPAGLAEAVWQYCEKEDIGLLWKYPDRTYVYRDHPEFQKIFSKNKKISAVSANPIIYDDHTVHLSQGANGGCLGCGLEALARFNQAFYGRCRGVDINGRSSDLLLWDVTKQTGLAALLRHIGIAPEECIAFGDNRNDLEILRFVGTSVAMGNGEEELKRVSHYVTEAVDRDGIALALQHFGLI